MGKRIRFDDHLYMMAKFCMEIKVGTVVINLKTY